MESRSQFTCTFFRVPFSLQGCLVYKYTMGTLSSQPHFSTLGWTPQQPSKLHSQRPTYLDSPDLIWPDLTNTKTGLRPPAYTPLRLSDHLRLCSPVFWTHSSTPAHHEPGNIRLAEGENGHSYCPGSSYIYRRLHHDSCLHWRDDWRRIEMVVCRGESSLTLSRHWMRLIDFAQCWLSIPALIYLVAVPMWIRAENLAKALLFASVDTLFAVWNMDLPVVWPRLTMRTDILAFGSHRCRSL